MFIQASQDDIPQVRKVAAIVLNDMIKLMPKVPEQELLKIFGQFFKDEQDSVKMQGIDSCIVFCKYLPNAVSAYRFKNARKSMLICFHTSKSTLKIRAGGSDILLLTKLWICLRVLASIKPESNYCQAIQVSCKILNQKLEQLALADYLISVKFLMAKQSSKKLFLA